ncbi:MAG: HAD hydrolase-like protein [bacterium]
MAGESVKKDSQQSAKKRQVALLFELEHSAVAGRAALFDVCKRLLTERDVEFTEALFVRHFQKLSIEKCIAELLEAVGKKRLSAAKLATEIAEEVKTALSDKRLKMSSGFSKLIEQAKAENAVFGALTALPKEVAEALVKRLGLDGVLAKINYAAPEADCFPTADAWLKLAKAVAVPPQGCIVITTSNSSCKAALSGGMRPVAAPDEFTGFQDFGGADLLVEKLNDEAATAIISLMIQSR